MRVLFLYFLCCATWFCWSLETGEAQPIFATPARGGAAGSKQQAQISVVQNEDSRMNACTVQGLLYAPNHSDANSNGCLPSHKIQPNGDIAIYSNATFGGNLSVAGNTNIAGSLNSSGRIYSSNGVHIQGDWLRIDGNNGIYFQSHGGGWNMSDSTWIRAYGGKGIYTSGDIRAEGSFKIGGNVFGPPPTCNSATQKLRWSGSAWQCIADTAGGAGSGEIDPHVGSLSNGRLCRSNGSQVICDQSYPASYAWSQPPACPASQKLNWTGSTWQCLTDQRGITSESDPQVGGLTNGRWCRSNGSQVICDQSPPSGGQSVSCSWSGWHKSTSAQCAAYIQFYCSGGKITQASIGSNYCPPNAG